jgi:hypothetical protein
MRMPRATCFAFFEKQFSRGPARRPPKTARYPAPAPKSLFYTVMIPRPGTENNRNRVKASRKGVFLSTAPDRDLSMASPPFRRTRTRAVMPGSDRNSCRKIPSRIRPRPRPPGSRPAKASQERTISSPSARTQSPLGGNEAPLEIHAPDARAITRPSARQSSPASTQSRMKVPKDLRSARNTPSRSRPRGGHGVFDPLPHPVFGQYRRGKPSASPAPPRGNR